MASIIASGIASGLDTAGIIDQLLAVENRPFVLLSLRKGSFEVKISSFGDLSSKLSSLKDALSSLKATTSLSISAISSDKSVMTASASSSASEGIYNIKVNNVATSQSIHSAIFTSESDAVADLSTVSTQKLKIQVGSSAAFTITVNSTNNTLKGVRDAIKNAKGGVTASTVNDGTGYRLVLSPDKTGADNRIVITVDEDNDGIYEEAGAEQDTVGLSDLAFNPASYDSNGIPSGGIQSLAQSQAAINASLVVDGLTITRASNTITDIITGITLNLLDDSSGNTLTLNVSKDLVSLTANINAFVSAYNGALGLAKSISVPTEEGGSAVLGGDSTARGIMTSLRGTIITSFSGETLAGFGLSHDKKGVLSLDASILDKATADDLQSVIDTFDAMAKSLESTIDNQVKTLIPAKTDGLNSSVDLIDDRMEALGRRLELREINLRRKFTALEQILAELQASGDFLTQQLAAISNISSIMSRRNR